MSERIPTASPAQAEGWFGKFLDLYLGGCAAVILFCLMMLTFVDVVGRDGFNTPFPGGFEITELMMAALIFTALPIVSWREEHVVIDLLDPLIPKTAARWRQVGVNLISTVAMGMLTWQTWETAVQLNAYDETTEYLQIPVAPIIFLISVMSAIAAFALFVNTLRYATGRSVPHASGGFG